jgi:hypothetical protein
LQPDTTFALGRATEISRDEIKFSKFITRIRNKFSELFTSLLERQLILRGVCTPDEWKEWKNIIQYKYAIDNYFEELKTMEIMRDRISLLRDMDDYIGKYISHEYARKYILQQTEQDIKDIDKQIKEEKNDERYVDDEFDASETQSSPRPDTPAPIAPNEVSDSNKENNDE